MDTLQGLLFLQAGAIVFLQPEAIPTIYLFVKSNAKKVYHDMWLRILYPEVEEGSESWLSSKVLELKFELFCSNCFEKFCRVSDIFWMDLILESWAVAVRTGSWLPN